MKSIIIKTMILNNIFGITATYDMEPGRNVFSGKNGVGKTRLANAEQWVLWGKNLEQNTKSEVRTLENGEIQLDSEHSCFLEYIIETDNKKELSVDTIKIGRLTKVKWTKPRGQVEQVRSGNEIIYFKDGLTVDKAEKITAKQFSDYILEKFGPDYQKVSILNYVSSMPWKDRRDLLTGLAPVDKQKVIESIPGFAEALAGKEPDERKEVAEKRLNTKDIGIKPKLAKNLSALEERKKDLEKIGSLSPSEAATKVVDVECEIGNCHTHISLLESGDNSGNLEKIKALNKKLAEIQNDFENRKQAAINAENDRLRNIKGIENELKNLNVDLQDHQELRQKLVADFQSEKAKTADAITEICESCGQVLPADVLNKLKENFNRDRSERMTQSKARWKDVMVEIERIERLIAENEGRLVGLKNTVYSYPSDKTEIEKIKKQIQELQPKESTDNPELERLKTTLIALNVKLKNAQEQQAAVNASEESKNRLKELEAERKKLSAENDKIQNFLAMYDEFIKSYADSVQGPVNELFKTARFRMFETLESGVKIPACVVCNEEWKPYDSMLSTGEKVGVDIDIKRVLEEKLDISAPSWIDERQSYTGQIDLKGQYFELITKENVEQLTKEV
jgi:hypothetical protein